jgi:hypothetical protein
VKLYSKEEQEKVFENFGIVVQSNEDTERTERHTLPPNAPNPIGTAIEGNE